jgi:membrane protein implicated in regulation of membrane protease activity
MPRNTTINYVLIGYILAITIGLLAAVVASGENWQGLVWLAIGLIIALIVQRIRRREDE